MTFRYFKVQSRPTKARQQKIGRNKNQQELFNRQKARRLSARVFPPQPIYPIEGDPGDVSVSRVQRSGHHSVVMYESISQTSFHTGVNTGPGDRGSIELEALKHQDRTSFN